MRPRTPALLSLVALALWMATAASASTYPEGDDPAGLVLVDLRILEKADALVLEAFLQNDGESRVHVLPVRSRSWSVHAAQRGWGGAMSRYSSNCCGPRMRSIAIEPGKRIPLGPLEISLDRFKDLPLEGPLRVRFGARVVRVDATGSLRAAFRLEDERTLRSLPSALLR